ncbi:MAG: DUF4870 domain-containing protein [Burkholderiaceae bacterium]|nr:DUF4870 domain-containing protein [Microbacteriaceae bacterium]
MSYENPQNPYAQTPKPLSPADEKLWATLTHVGGIVFYFIPALVAYLVLKDRGPFVRAHTAAALNFQLTLAIVYLAGSFLSWLVVPIIAIVAAGIFSVVMSIIAAVAANNGQYYRYPLTIEFVK